MRVGLIDVDGHNYPNLPLMKISAYHKSKGDSVEWYEPMFSGHMDRVYMSKVFSNTPDYEYCIDADEIYRGAVGTQFLWWMERKCLTKRKTKISRMRLNTYTPTILCTNILPRTRLTDF